MSTTTQVGTLTAVCKLRQVRPYLPTQQMIIRNLEAHRLMISSLMLEDEKQWGAATVPKEEAKEVLDLELRQYLGGVKHTIPINSDSVGMGDIGATQW